VQERGQGGGRSRTARARGRGSLAGVRAMPWSGRTDRTCDSPGGSRSLTSSHGGNASSSDGGGAAPPAPAALPGPRASGLRAAAAMAPAPTPCACSWPLQPRGAVAMGGEIGQNAPKQAARSRFLFLHSDAIGLGQVCCGGRRSPCGRQGEAGGALLRPAGRGRLARGPDAAPPPPPRRMGAGGRGRPACRTPPTRALQEKIYTNRDSQGRPGRAAPGGGGPWPRGQPYPVGARRAGWEGAVAGPRVRAAAETARAAGGGDEPTTRELSRVQPPALVPSAHHADLNLDFTLPTKASIWSCSR
jgi:hypothetical protein